MLKASQKTNKARGLARGIAVKHARQHHRLVGDEAHRAAAMRPKPVMMFLAKVSEISKKSPSSTTFWINSFMS